MTLDRVFFWLAYAVGVFHWLGGDHVPLMVDVPFTWDYEGKTGAA